MLKYNEITFWENRKRLEILIDLRNNIVTYFNNLKLREGTFNQLVPENEAALKARIEINFVLMAAHKILMNTGVTTKIVYSPPPMIGGLIREIDLLVNIFNLERFDVQPNMLLDTIERAIGIYERDRLNSLWRTFNPLFWIGLTLNVISGLPFRFIEKLGYNVEGIEGSFWGKTVRLVVYLIPVIAGFLTVLEKTGHLEAFVNWIHKIGL